MTWVLYMETAFMVRLDFGRQQVMYHPLASVTKCLLAGRKGYGQETVTKGHRVPWAGWNRNQPARQAVPTVNPVDQG